MQRTDSEKLILELNYQNELINERTDPVELNSEKMLHLLPETVVDKRTLQVLEVHDLFKAVDFTMTSVGSAHLFHSLVNPSESIELIHAKQDSYYELAANQKLQREILVFLDTFREKEKHFFKFINAHMHPLVAYRDYKKAMAAIQSMVEDVNNIPQPETVYLDSLIKSIKSFSASQAFAFTNGPAYRTLGKILTKAEKKRFAPTLKFRPSRLSFGSLAPAFPGVFFASGKYFEFMNPAIAEAMFYLTGWMVLLGMAYGGIFKPMIDFDTAVLPIRKRILESNRFASAIEGVAGIDELMSFVIFGETFPYPTVVPEITNDKTHYFVAKELRNPILVRKGMEHIPNDVNLDGSKITFITGPNSGGKTTYCKTIAQNQILGQIGAPVVARHAKMNMADMIMYQAPSFDSLSDPEGRFGTELKLTKEVFFSVTPKSLVVLDEIAEGTTTHEKLSLSEDILDGFYTIGNNTIMVTHSFELVERFQENGKGQYLKAGFNNEHPTYIMTEGISKESHAHRVAKKIGFSPEDIKKYLKEKGYL